jgi:two-component system, OmpR family, catabolic regulation response regulator CreB
MKIPETVILIVEDESVIAETIIFALESEGLKTKWVATGQDALTYISQSTPNLVILDVGLPDQSGFKVCKDIRSFSDIPILFLTSRSSDLDEVRGLESGADDYITKPFTPQVLALRVLNKLKRFKNSSHESLDGGILIDDRAAKTISLDGVNIDLTRYEYLILSQMMSYPNRKYSREELLSAASLDSESFDRTIDTHIKTIRKKIVNVKFGYNPIKTHRNLGYSYEA